MKLHQSKIRIKKVRGISQIKVVRYEESIYYANAENFKNRLVKSIGINPFEIIIQRKQNELKMKKVELWLEKKPQLNKKTFDHLLFLTFLFLR